MKPLFLVQSHKFSRDNFKTTLVFPKCEEAFKKEFPIDLEGQITEFRCPVCNGSGEANLPFSGIEERERIDRDHEEMEENINDVSSTA
jgi:hypothetical protein